MIVQTLTAVCDNLLCGRAEIINPETTQRWQYLRLLGWHLVNTDENILTFCPDHPPTEEDQ